MEINLNQTVRLFSDEDRIGIQEVTIDTADELGNWIVISHDGNELSMSLENWEKLSELVQKAKSQIDEKNQQKKETRSVQSKNIFSSREHPFDGRSPY